jgi:DNA repair protein RadC
MIILETVTRRATTKGPMKTQLDQFVIRTERVGEPIPQITADTPEMIHEFHQLVIRPTMQEGKEHLHVVLLGSRLRVMGWHLVSMGGLAETHAHPREILRPVILAGAYGFAVIHNHPSGDPSPSRADEMMTRRLVDASAIMQVRMIDHVIAADAPMRGGSRYYSLREAGMIP